MGITAILQRLHLLRSEEWDPPTPLDHLLTDMQSWPLFIIPIHLHFLRLVITHLYHLFLFLRGHAFHPPSHIPPIRVVCISDTHNYELDLAKIPDGEGGLLIHAGDLTDDGSRESIQRQLDWLGEVRRRKGFERVLVVAGNHDGWLDKEGARQVLFGEGSKGDAELTWPEGVQYLDGMAGEGGENGGVMTIEFEGRAKGRRLNVWGWGGVPRCGGPEHAFQYDRASHPWTNRIPVETDILITHTPPRHHLDLGLGCAGLLAELWRVKPKLHVFGHVHWGAGREAVYYDECQRAYESLMARGADVPFPPAFPSIFSFPASVSALSQSASQNRQEPRSKMQEKQKPTNLVNILMLPVYFGLTLSLYFVKVFERVWMDSMDAARVIWHGITAVVWKWVMQGPGSNNGALLVNASVTYGNTGKVINPVQVVEL
ncbi:Metallo-dependent phosphatase [Neurospora crassa]|uniref:Metallophosphoesterase domain-containing protein 2 n=1 Tax=Neurospora crassa (strain ATCC 24698 / 74-OR23-1A / CBS 708.71 / DSM 1257 / FGSC 987) TaxID=367110 RepID=Q7S9T1_NEUCR|nr:metallophosphoesterase domain-containing protein 2 [Neurospora crassa OR74A]EAA33173.1 metallophosphoesterase domain-containing protein 2 [Neurospora crassa OR74A]KHE85562.1 Metallo-dependent phosphatase [Neurospora crassa]|eukprot:XP_962409.1 metallophosphoesterase domain-containing protein 2 [Neurospora crassa OR74A]